MYKINLNKMITYNFKGSMTKILLKIYIKKLHKKVSKKEEQEMIQIIEITNVDAEKVIYHIQHYILILNKSMKEKLT